MRTKIYLNPVSHVKHQPSRSFHGRNWSNKEFANPYSGRFGLIKGLNTHLIAIIRITIEMQDMQDVRPQKKGLDI